jgi:hypothetical protein
MSRVLPRLRLLRIYDDVMSYGAILVSPSYIIFKIDNKVYARNGLTGQVEYGSSDATEVIQYAVDNVPGTGGTVFIKSGLYILNGPIVIRKFVNLVGEGVRATVLKLAPGANSSMIDYAIPSDLADQVSQLMYVAHMMLDGNKTEQTQGTSAIRTVVPGYANARDWAIFDVWIDNYKGDGIFLVSHNYYVSHVAIEHNDGWGIRLNGFGGFIIGNWLWMNNEGGIYHYFTGSNANPNVIAFNLIGGGRRGIRIEGSSSGLYRVHIIVGNFIVGTDPNEDLIYINNTRYTLIYNNFLNGVNNRYTLYEDTGADETQAIDNYLARSQIPPYFKLSGARSMLRSWGYQRTVNTGVATIPALQTRVTVSHGLVTSPSKVLVTPYSNIRVWVENIRSTTFDIVTDTVPATNISVAWYAEV